MMRKPPGRHTVKKHRRQGKPVKTYKRGSGKLLNKTRSQGQREKLFISSLQASKIVRSRHPRNQQEHEARNVKIHSLPIGAHGGKKPEVTFERDKKDGPNPMNPTVRRNEGKEWDQKRDEARLNKRILDPTNPTHQGMWMDHPERYDMADVDTPFRDDDVITLFRGIRGRSGYKKYLREYNNQVSGLGQYWTGNIQVARLYATRGTVTITDGPTLSGMDKWVDEKLKSQREQRKNLKDFGVPLESIYHGVIFKYDAQGREINVYNPEGIPHEMEARQAEMKYKGKQMDLPLSEKYPGIEIGFIKGITGRTVEWHKVTKDMEDKTLYDIAKLKPTRISPIKPVKEVIKHITYTPKYATKPRTVEVIKVTTESEGKVQVAKEPSRRTKWILDQIKGERK